MLQAFQRALSAFVPKSSLLSDSKPAMDDPFVYLNGTMTPLSEAKFGETSAVVSFVKPAGNHINEP